MKGDAEKAFQKIKRGPMLGKLAQLWPFLIRLALSLYGGPSPMFFSFTYGRKGGFSALWCTLGVHQGCVLGSFLFALGASAAFRHLVAAYPDCVAFFLADDLALCGPPASAREYLADIKEEGERVAGYELNLKTELWSPDGSIDFASWGQAACDNAGNPFTVATCGFELLGSYVGDSDAVLVHVEKRVWKHKKLLSTINAMDDKQAAYTLTRYCANQRIRRVLRVHDTLGGHP